MGRDQHRGWEAEDELGDRVHAGKVEVVGRFVKEQQVVAADQDGSQPGPGRLAPGQAAQRPVDGDVQPDAGEDLCEPYLEVGATEVEPAVEGEGVGVAVVGVVGEGCCRLLELPLRCGDPGAAADVVEDRLCGRRG